MPRLPLSLITLEDAKFWDQFDKNLYGKTAQVLLSIFLAGGKVGAGQLPSKMQVLVDWDVFNKAAQDYLKLYRLNTVRMVSETTRENVIQIISDWMESGEPFQMLPTRLEPWLGASRAERIAVTEVTRTYAAGNQAAWKSSGVVTARVFRTAEDERVCILCGSMDGKVTGIDADYSLTEEDLQDFASKNDIEIPKGILQQAQAGNLTWTIPPLHVHCRCFQAPITSEVSLRENIRGILNEGD